MFKVGDKAIWDGRLPIVTSEYSLIDYGEQEVTITKVDRDSNTKIPYLIKTNANHH